MSEKYYVYGAYGLHGELLYIGYGKGDRHKHCNNGMSSNKGLNRYYNVYVCHLYHIRYLPKEAR